MKRLTTFLLIALSVCVFALTEAQQPASAQQLGSARQPVAAKYPAVQQNPEFLRGTDFLCPTGPQKMTPAPKGFEAFYISHYGRHGARYAWQDDFYDYLGDLLASAAREGNLTPEGQHLREVFLQIYPDAKNREGDLSAVGWAQQQKLAERMYLNFPSVFASQKGSKPTINAYTSNSTRCVMTMSSFCLGLKAMDPKLDITENFGRVYLHAILPQSSADPRRDRLYPRTPLKFPETLSEYQKERVDFDSLLGHFFKNPSASISRDNRWKTINYLYFLVNGTVSIDAPDLTGLLTEDERVALWDIDNIQFYMDAWPGRYGYMPIIEDIISKADSAIDRKGGRGADLRFGHDYTIYPLMMLLGVNGMDHECLSAAEISDWFQNQNIPMGASVQLVFYRSKKSSDILFKILLNGAEATLPIATDKWPYYNWNDFKAHYTNLAQDNGADDVASGPWITNVTDDSVSILWLTKSSSTGWVETSDGEKVYDTYAGRRTFGTFHRVDLKAAKSLTYRVGGEFLRDASNPRYPRFGASWCGAWTDAKLFDNQSTTSTFSVMNDIHCAKDIYWTLTSGIDPEKTDFIFLNGDIASVDNYSLEDLIGYEIDPMGDYPAKLPVFFARGNHEGRGTGIRDVGKVFPNPNSSDAGRFYYTFRQGPAAFVVFDAGETGTDRSLLYCGKEVYEDYMNEQIEWAKTALAEPEFASAPLKVCFIHAPMIDPEDKNDFIIHRWMNHHFMDLLNKAGIDLMIGADLHDPYEFLPGTMGNAFPIVVNDDRVRLDFSAAEGTMTLRCVDPAGRETYSASFPY